MATAKKVMKVTAAAAAPKAVKKTMKKAKGAMKVAAPLAASKAVKKAMETASWWAPKAKKKAMKDDPLHWTRRNSRAVRAFVFVAWYDTLGLGPVRAIQSYF